MRHAHSRSPTSVYPRYTAQDQRPRPQCHSPFTRWTALSMDYITANMSVAQPRNGHAHQQQQAVDPDQEIERQLHAFRRTVTIIIWTKANADPLRLVCYIPTFPYFQLSQLPNVVDELGLSNGAYLDTYVPNTNQWEQHTITSVRLIGTQQRLIYKLRRSLMDSLSEDECLSLHEELQLQCRDTNGATIGRGNSQPPPSLDAQALHSPTADETKLGNASHPKSMLKRSAPQGDHDTGHSPKIHVSGDYYLAHGSSSSGNVNSSAAAHGIDQPSAISSGSQMNSHAEPGQPSQQQQQSQQENMYMYQSNNVFYGGTSGPSGADSLPHYLLAPPAPAPPIPYHPHPPLKRWPNDYTVSELSNGFHAMDVLVSSSPTGANMTQRMAFERVFGSRYVKSTVCRHRAVWRKAPPTLRQQYEAMGLDDRACWGEFVRKVEGRPPMKVTVPGSISSDGSTMGDYHDQRTPSPGDDVRGPESVMGGMQVPSSGNNGGMQTSMAVYDNQHVHHHSSGHNAGHNGSAHPSGHNPGHSG